MLFDGKTVLPKAATPMTAALTIISYGDKLSAEIEFFTESDIDDIRKQHDEYLKQRDKLIEKNKEELREKEKRTSFNKTQFFQSSKYESNHSYSSDLEDRAKRRAARELREKTSLRASFEQYEKIKESRISINDIRSNSKAQIVVSSVTELSDKLIEYVGASGKYMPFTKSVHIKIPDDKLLDLQIVDTPGINDPVRSREERTQKLLKYCDAILIVSPSGQFINRNDIDLMDRITSKEGVRELYVVASQVDTQLLGSIRRDSDGDLHKALSLITEQLSKQLANSIEKLKSEYPEVCDTYDQLIHQNSERIIHTSGIAKTIITLWESRDKWDSGTTKVWENLTTHYPDNFSDKNNTLSIANLEKLANIGTVERIIKDVREKKDKILRIRENEFIRAKENSLNEFQMKLIHFIDDKLKRLQEMDIGKLREQHENLQKIKNKGSVHLDEEYFFAISEIEHKLGNELFATVNSFFRDAKKHVQEAKETETETYKVKKSGFWGWVAGLFGNGYETRTRRRQVVRTGAIQDVLESLTSDIENAVTNKSKILVLEWRKKTPQRLIKTIRHHVNDTDIEIHILIQALRKVFNRITYPEIRYSSELPYSLRAQGILTGSSARSYIENTHVYISQLQREVMTDIKRFISDFSRELKSVDFSSTLFKNYDKSIREITQQIETKELTVDRFKRLRTELHEVM